MFWAEIWKMSDFFLSENFHYLVVKFYILVYLNRHVFVMKLYRHLFMMFCFIAAWWRFIIYCNVSRMTWRILRGPNVSFAAASGFRATFRSNKTCLRLRPSQLSIFSWSLQAGSTVVVILCLYVGYCIFAVMFCHWLLSSLLLAVPWEGCVSW